MAFYPGMQILIGEHVPAAKSLNSFFLARETLGLLPERFDFVNWKTVGNGDVHPLRPELIESNYFLHLASIGHGRKRGPSYHNSPQHTSSWLWAADFALNGDVYMRFRIFSSHNNQQHFSNELCCYSPATHFASYQCSFTGSVWFCNRCETRAEDRRL